jgi:glyoxylase-like metal-dependent hydrolase (beta-lactamase superfamily II)
MFSTRYLSALEQERMKEKLPEDNGAYLTIAEGFTFELGQMSLEVLEVPGHTPGSLMLYDRNNQRLYTGDSISEDNIFMFGDGRNIKVLIESLKRLKEMNLEVEDILPSHGTCPLYGLNELIDDIIAGSEKYLRGQEETDVITLNYGNPFQVKRYRNNRAKILAEVIEE